MGIGADLAVLKVGDQFLEVKNMLLLVLFVLWIVLRRGYRRSWYRPMYFGPAYRPMMMYGHRHHHRGPGMMRGPEMIRGHRPMGPRF